VTLDYVPYENGLRFVVTASAQLRLSAAFLNCARLSFASSDDREKYHLYFSPSQSKREFFIAFRPSIGIYLVPPPNSMKTTTSATASTDQEPAVPPTDPFAERVPACPSSAKPLAQAMVAAVRGARAAALRGAPVSPNDVADITAHGTPPSGWLELKPRDPFAGTALLQCLHVAGVSPAHLAATGIADARRHGFGFSDRFGFYLIASPEKVSP